MIKYNQMLLMTDLPFILRELMARNQLKGVDVAKQAKMTPSNFSRILNKGTKPRRSNFDRIVKAVSRAPFQEKILYEVYEGNEIDILDLDQPLEAKKQLSEESNVNEEAVKYNEGTYIDKYFLEDVAFALKRGKIRVIPDFNSEGHYCHFVTKIKNQIGIYCISNPRRDWKQTFGHCMMLRNVLPIDDLIVCVPYHGEFTEASQLIFQNVNIPVVPFHKLVKTLKKMGA